MRVRCASSATARRGRAPGPVTPRADWPDLLTILEQRVKGTRARHSTAPWWQFERIRPELYTAIAGLERVLAISQVTQHVAFAQLPAGMVYAHRLYVIRDSSHPTFAVLQSNVHDIWARGLGD